MYIIIFCTCVWCCVIENCRYSDLLSYESPSSISLMQLVILTRYSNFIDYSFAFQMITWCQCVWLELCEFPNQWTFYCFTILFRYPVYDKKEQGKNNKKINSIGTIWIISKYISKKYNVMIETTCCSNNYLPTSCRVLFLCIAIKWENADDNRTFLRRNRRIFNHTHIFFIIFQTKENDKK